jgi:hypothetical protein
MAPILSPEHTPIPFGSADSRRNRAKAMPSSRRVVRRDSRRVAPPTVET